MTNGLRKKADSKPKLPEWFNKKLSQPANIYELACGDFLRLGLPKNEPILGEWLVKQSLSMIYGPRGCGKTYLALDIAYSIATGSSLFEWDADVPRKVLYLDGEMSAAALQGRLRKLTKSRGNEPKEMLRIVTPDLQMGVLPDLSTLKEQEMINHAIDRDTEVIIVDNLSSWSKTGREDAETWAPIAEWALKLRSLGKAVIFIHHSGKSGAQRGTSRREDLLDTVIALTSPSGYKPSDGAYFEVKFEKSRNLTGTGLNPFFAKLNENKNGKLIWDWGPIVPKVDERKQVAIQMAKDGLSQTGIAKELGVDKSSVSRWLKEMKIP